MILTGDLGKVGSELLYELLLKENISIAEKHNDCGLMIYDLERQDVHAGGSGCGCSASVLCSKILNDFKAIMPDRFFERKLIEDEFVIYFITFEKRSFKFFSYAIV